MKDVFKQKVTFPISYLAESVETPLIPSVKVSDGFLTQSQGYRRVRRSAAMLGLAISMGASGMVLADKASATTGTVNSQATLSDFVPEPNQSLSAPESLNSQLLGASQSLSPPVLKYEVQAGETVWQISQEFRVDPEIIATTNQLSTHSSLVEGQTLNIPSTSSAGAVGSSPSLTIATKPTVIVPAGTAIASAPRPLQKISSSQSRLQPIALSSPIAVIEADVADVSQSIQIQVIPAESAAMPEKLEAAAKEAGVYVTATPRPSHNSLSRPVPIPAVPSQTSSGAFLPSTDSEPNLPPLASPPIARKPEADSETLPEVGTRSIQKLQPTPSTVTAFNQPRQIPVIAPAAQSQDFQNVPPPQLIIPRSTSVSPRTYQVKPGDTIHHIARELGLSSQAILQVNQITNPNIIKVNQTLVLPEQRQSAPAHSQKLASISFPVAKNLSSKESKVSNQTLSTQDAAVPLLVEDSKPEFTHRLQRSVAQSNQDYLTAGTHGTTAIPSEIKDVDDEILETQESDHNATDDRRVPRGFTAPRASLSKLQRDYRSGSSKQLETNDQVLGAVPTAAQEYNPSFELPVGIEVTPALPSLSEPNIPEIPTEFTGFIWPAKGVLTSGFGRRWGRAHRGIDIAAPIGTPIMAAAAGEVISAGWNSGGFGKLVKIRHADGSVTYYAHNHRILVRRGDYVQQGQQVAEMGSTGRSTGPHLHFEIRPNGKGAVNPVAMLPRR